MSFNIRRLVHPLLAGAMFLFCFTYVAVVRIKNSDGEADRSRPDSMQFSISFEDVYALLVSENEKSRVPEYSFRMK